MLKRMALMGLVYALPAFAGGPAYRPAYAFRCGSVSHFGDGTLVISRWIRHNRQLASTSVQWTPKMSEFSRTYLEARWGAIPPDKINFDKGSLTISYRLIGKDYTRGPARPFIELSVSHIGDTTGIKGWMDPRRSKDTIRLETDWARVRKLAETRDLYLLVSDASGAIVDTITLPQNLFWVPSPAASYLKDAEVGPEPDALLGYGCETDTSPRH